MKDLPTSMVALLVSEACNIGLAPVVNPGYEALTRARLVHVNAIVLWTTRYIDAAVAQLKAEGHEIRDEDIARLSALKHRNLNLLGRYSFTASPSAAGALRPLCDPEASEPDEVDDGGQE